MSFFRCFLSKMKAITSAFSLNLYICYVWSAKMNTNATTSILDGNLTWLNDTSTRYLWIVLFKSTSIYVTQVLYFPILYLFIFNLVKDDVCTAFYNRLYCIGIFSLLNAVCLTIILHSNCHYYLYTVLVKIDIEIYLITSTLLSTLSVMYF